MRNIFNIFRKKEPKSISKATWEDIKILLEPHKRLAWVPNSEEKTSHPLSSKFSGIPALSKDECWPCCKNCEEPMQLFLQINSQELPDCQRNVFGGDILQVFYCTNWETECEVNCDAFFPFSKSTLLRIVDYSAENISSPEKSPVKEPFPEKPITGWEPKDDYPNWEELENLGITLSETQCDLLCEHDYPLTKDKLLGWPYWVQGVEYPDCPDCSKPMKLLFQIDSEDNLPYMFGDAGCSHITQCETHKDKLAIAWACY